MDLSFTPDEQSFAVEIAAWLRANLDAPESFGSMEEEIEWGRRWQARLSADRWIGIHWPYEFGGRGASPIEVALYNMEYARARAPQPVNRVGINLAGPTLLAHGTDAQRARWLPRILDASEIWCQLFSEPDAGSDLASLETRAQQTEGGWLVSGQKVWTSYATFARWGICLARTDPEAPKHRGISYLVVDMTSPGIDIRPLVQLTGDAEFNEVFMDEVFVPSEHLVGDLNRGWAVANTTLAHERGTSFPFKEQVVHEVFLGELCDLAGRAGLLDDVEVCDELLQAFVDLRVLRLHNWRTLSRLARGLEPGPESSWIKLHWTAMTQALSEAALRLTGLSGPLYQGAAGNPQDGKWQRQWLWSKAASIAGGTSEIQKTIIAERILGLPR
ncbi:MAG: putative acyl-CoA dehydrogenase FadE17 [Acidimicrobiales bacterium]|nr:MAG: acyl-CoA dehydrogenase [Actinomycetota bacterium]MBV6507669.1 putative acyl-CoA dehydrogenase FadE17 [Acidimicrobiales bacterium]RIK07598.1 MAG: acyl-CoA dehydrogenase [Acidobacteriota bacterium]